MSPFRLSLYLALGLGAFLQPAGIQAQSAEDEFRPDVNGVVHAMVEQPDGKVVIVGSFSQVGGLPRSNVARLLPDGRVDSQFIANALAGDACPGCGWVSDVALQHDGKILLGGYFVSVGGFPRTNLARLHPEGDLDLLFAASTEGSAPLGRVGVAALALHEDGRILVGGGFTRLNGLACTNLGRLNSDGSVDGTFTSGTDQEVLEITTLSGGRILIGGAFRVVGGLPRSNLARLRADGAVEPFGAPGVGEGPAACFGSTWISTLLVQPDGKVLVGGLFCSLNGAMRRSIARLNTDGQVDASFDAGTTGLCLSNAPVNLALQPDGRILVGGDLDHLVGVPRNHLGRLNADGTLDPTFNPGADGPVHCFLRQANGGVLVGGQFNSLAGVSRPGLGRLHEDGTPDKTLDTAINGVSVRAVLQQPDEKVLIAGSFVGVGGHPRTNIARMQPSGEIDPLRYDVPATTVYGLALQGDLRLIAYGASFIARWTEGGIRENSFQVPVDGAVRCVAIQPDGKIVLGGEFRTVAGEPRRRLTRIHADGTLDGTFSASAEGIWVLCVALQADGKILVGGVFTNLNGQASTNIGRLNADGSLDASFTRYADREVNCFALQPDGKILVGGRFSILAGQPCIRLGRLNPDGSLDGTFQSKASNNSDRIQSLALQADGRVLAHGSFSNGSSQVVNSIVRLHPDGALDETFDPVEGIVSINGLALQADGKLLSANGFANIVGGLRRTNLARLSNPTAALQQISAGGPGRSVMWWRNGSAPEVGQVTFEQSSDGTNYVRLGSATRTTNGWMLAGLTLPAGESVYLRARGRTSGGQFNGSSGLMQSVARIWRLPPPFLSEAQVLGNGAFQFRWPETNSAGFVVLASTNAAAPIASWDWLGAPVPLGGRSLPVHRPTSGKPFTALLPIARAVNRALVSSHRPMQ